MRHTPYASVLARRGFAGRRIRKVTLSGGFTCPNLDGTKGRGGCTFCDNRSFSPVAAGRGTPIARQLGEGIACHRSRSRTDGLIAYFQPFSGTYAPDEWEPLGFAALEAELARRGTWQGCALGDPPPEAGAKECHALASV